MSNLKPNPFSDRSYWTSYHQTIHEFLSKLFPHTTFVPFPTDLNTAVALCRMIAADSDESPVPTIFPESVILRPMAQSRCHDNCAQLLYNGQCNSMVTGYALSPDGMWRYHSWCLDHECNLIETTERRIVYIPVETVPYH